jgi:peptide deformylase
LVVLSIRYAPDPVLNRKASKIAKVDAVTKRFVEDMLETMHYNGGVGLAANQVGSLRRVAVIQMPEEEPLVLVNPRIVHREGEREIEEGCLSIPGYQGLVKRSVKVRVRAQDLEGRQVEIEAEDDLLAQALEHEVDHLDGVLYIERLARKDAFWKLEPKEDSDEAEETESQ